MLAWIAGAAIGLAPGLDTRLGIGVATAVALVAVVIEIVAAWRLRDDVLDRPAPIAKPALTAAAPASPAAIEAAPASPAAYPAPPTYPPGAPAQAVVIVGETVPPANPQARPALVAGQHRGTLPGARSRPVRVPADLGRARR